MTTNNNGGGSRPEVALERAKARLHLQKPVPERVEIHLKDADTPHDPCGTPATCAKADWLRPTSRQLRLISTPRVGQYYWVDFPADTALPEFNSRHPAVVVRAANSLKDVCVVVPLTSTQPQELMPYQYELKSNPNPYDPKRRVWAICNHLYTVHLNRLNPVQYRGTKQFPRVSNEDRVGIFQAIGKAFPFLAAAQANPAGRAVTA